MHLKFNDGVTLDTSGPYRIRVVTDPEGPCYLVLGQGSSVPFNTMKEAEAYLAKAKTWEKKK